MARKKLRILMLNFEFPPLGGGAANANFYLLKEFAKHELCVDLITASPSSDEIEQFSKNIRIFKLDVGKKDRHYWRSKELLVWTWRASRMMKRLLREHKYDLVHCWFGWPSGLLGYWFRKEIPYIVALRGSDIPGYSSRTKMLDKFMRRLSRLVWNKSLAVTTLSKDSSRLARKTLNHNFKIIYNGVDTEEFYPEKSNCGHLKILCVGRLIERKAYKYVIEAISDLNKRQPSSKFSLTLIGDGPEKDTLLRFVKHEKLIKRVKFLGAIDHNSLPGHYRKHDVFVLPSINEALGNVMHEAIASGLAIITTPTGAAELIDGNGVLVSKRSSKSIADVLENFLLDNKLVETLKKRSIDLAKEMSWSKTAQQYMAIYSQVLK